MISPSDAHGTHQLSADGEAWTSIAPILVSLVQGACPWAAHPLVVVRRLPSLPLEGNMIHMDLSCSCENLELSRFECHAFFPALAIQDIFARSKGRMTITVAYQNQWQKRG
jgi:hypothetical protein